MKYDQLISEVQKHNKAYYDNNRPLISDAEYDRLYDALLATEKAQGWAAHNSPTRQVGGVGGKIKHKYRLYSLKKVYDKQDIDEEFAIETPKIDGACLTLTFEKGKLYNMLTRGNGEYGDDVRHLFPYLKGVPSKISSDYEEITVTGECVTDNKEVENFRNYVSGALGLKDEKEFANRNIKFIAHDWLGVELSYTKRMEILANMGFTTVFTINPDLYPTDGKVYRVNSFKKSKELGYTNKYPRFAVALKPRGLLTAVTTLQDVEWVVGRTGTVNPTGIVSPVSLDDATITRVTLHNIGIIEDHQLSLGDTIEIERAGGVIPKFIRKVVESPHNARITTEQAEKAIGCKTKRVGPKLYVSEGHKNINRKNLEHYIKTMQIKGLGPRSIDKMELTHITDLYETEVSWTARLGINGTKVKAEIERSKTKPYEIVLASLGIPGVGLSTAKDICKHIPEFAKLRDIEFTNIKGIADKTKEKILSWLDVNENWVFTLPVNLVADDKDIYFEEEESSVKRKICVTGKMDMTKNDLKDHLASYGFNLVDNVTKDCYALIIAGDKNSGKAQKAEKYGVKVIDYWEQKSSILKGQL